jgi:thiol:disulfide interchange protein DsbD
MKSILSILLLCFTFLLPLAHAEEDFLEPDAAFALSHKLNDQQLALSWNIAKGYYLYQDRLKINGKPIDKNLLPKAELKNDPVFGDVMIYKYHVDANIPRKDLSGDVKIEWQGCADAGLCYPPQKLTINLPATSIATPTPIIDNQPQANSVKESTQPLSETDQIAGMLANDSAWITIAFFFGIGLLLAFTPCVFPMIPILSSIIVGQGTKITTRKAFTLSLVYVLAMAFTYTLAGVLAGLFGANLQAAFQTPWVLIAFSLIFVALAVSMFGFYELQLPASLQAKLADISNQQQGGSLTGVAIMGLLSALIVGPCVAPPLAGALIYIGQTGDAFLGGAALFAMSLGMGLPLLAIGTAAGKWMPRAGGWMDNVKAVFGVSLLAVAIWMLSRILPETITLILWALLAISSAVYLGALGTAETGWQKFFKSLGIALLIWGTLMLIGAAAGSKSALQPLANLASTSNQVSQTHPSFSPIRNSTELDAALTSAKQQGKTVMLDFYADWCVSCKEMESFAFTNPQVADAMSQMLLLQINMTDNTAEHQALLKRFNLVGPPAILFFGAQGEEKRSLRVVGFMNAEKFHQHLKRVQQP